MKLDVVLLLFVQDWDPENIFSVRLILVGFGGVNMKCAGSSTD